MIEKAQIGYPKGGNQSTKEMMKTTANSNNKNGLKTSGPRQNDAEEAKNLNKSSKVNEPYNKNKSNRLNKKSTKGSATPEEDKNNSKPSEHKVNNFRDRGQTNSGKLNKPKETADLSAGNPSKGVPSHYKNPSSASKQNKKLLPDQT
jgi:hypothetical protein